MFKKMNWAWFWFLTLIMVAIAWAADTKLSALTELAATPADSDEFYVNDSGTSKKIQYSNLLGNSAQTDANETIAGTWDFDAFPTTPSAAPTTDYQTANKKYVDDNSGGSGNVSTSGSPVADELAIFTSGSEITGTTTFNLVFRDTIPYDEHRDSDSAGSELDEVSARKYSNLSTTAVGSEVSDVWFMYMKTGSEQTYSFWDGSEDELILGPMTNSATPSLISNKSAIKIAFDGATAIFQSALSTAAKLIFGSGDENVEIRLDSSPDTDDTYSASLAFKGTAGESLTQWDIVFLNDTDGEYHQADADATGEWPSRAMCVTSGAGDGSEIILMTQGVVRNDGWTWSGEGSELYLSDTAGGITETAPSTSGDCGQLIGWTISDDEIYLNISGHYVVVD